MFCSNLLRLKRFEKKHLILKIFDGHQSTCTILYILANQFFVVDNFIFNSL